MSSLYKVLLIAAIAIFSYIISAQYYDGYIVFSLISVGVGIVLIFFGGTIISRMLHIISKIKDLRINEAAIDLKMNEKQIRILLILTIVLILVLNIYLIDRINSLERKIAENKGLLHRSLVTISNQIDQLESDVDEQKTSLGSKLEQLELDLMVIQQNQLY